MRSSPAGEMEHPFRPLPSSSIGETSRRRLPTGELRMSGEFEHRPVMLDEIVEVFRPVPEGLVVDATLGGGGHARALLSALPRIRLVGLDRDEQALAAAARTLAPFEGRWAARRGRGHPAKRSFQALRIEVNGELAVLPSAVDQAIDVLVPGGRCAVLSYHSGEDRIVKERFANAATGGCTCPPKLPCVCGAT